MYMKSLQYIPAWRTYNWITLLYSRKSTILQYINYISIKMLIKKINAGCPRETPSMDSAGQHGAGALETAAGGPLEASSPLQPVRMKWMTQWAKHQFRDCRSSPIMSVWGPSCSSGLSKSKSDPLFCRQQGRLASSARTPVFPALGKPHSLTLAPPSLRPTRKEEISVFR